MNTHTPGPWCLFDYGEGWHINQAGGPGFIGSLPRYKHREKECEANANLIAAAPDLLEALDSIMEICSQGRQIYPATMAERVAEVLITARAAIAKSRGGA